MNTANHQDVYTRVTNKIIADLEQGTRPWLKPWTSTNAVERIILPLRHNGVHYRGVNILLLLGEAMEKGYSSSQWMTFKQATELGAHVRKGEHGALVVYANTLTKTEENASGEEVEREIPFMNGYTVFNVEQIDGLPDSHKAEPKPAGEKLQLIEQAEAYFVATGAAFRHGGNRAYFAPGLDVIQLPLVEAFRDAESYSAVKAHELTHWTGHPSRLDRMLGKRFGEDAYAAEELIAELGAAFLSVELGITPEPRDDHAAYLAFWLKVLKDDKKAIFTAAAQAQRAVDYLRSLPSTSVS